MKIISNYNEKDEEREISLQMVYEFFTEYKKYDMLPILGMLPCIKKIQIYYQYGYTPKCILYFHNTNELLYLYDDCFQEMDMKFREVKNED